MVALQLEVSLKLFLEISVRHQNLVRIRSHAAKFESVERTLGADNPSPMKNWSSILEFYEYGHKNQKGRQDQHPEARTHDIDGSLQKRRPRRPDWRHWKFEGSHGFVRTSNEQQFLRSCHGFAEYSISDGVQGCQLVGQLWAPDTLARQTHHTSRLSKPPSWAPTPAASNCLQSFGAREVICAAADRRR